MSAHTPGPWCVSNWRIVDDSDGSIAYCATTRLVTECDANIRLIAAAPDLLAALDPRSLEVIAEELERSGDQYAPMRAKSLRAIAANQRAAIAKAKVDE